MKLDLPLKGLRLVRPLSILYLFFTYVPLVAAEDLIGEFSFPSMDHIQRFEEALSDLESQVKVLEMAWIPEVRQEKLQADYDHSRRARSIFEMLVNEERVWLEWLRPLFGHEANQKILTQDHSNELTMLMVRSSGVGRIFFLKDTRYFNPSGDGFYPRESPSLTYSTLGQFFKGGEAILEFWVKIPKCFESFEKKMLDQYTDHRTHEELRRALIKLELQVHEELKAATESWFSFARAQTERFKSRHGPQYFESCVTHLKEVISASKKSP